MSVKRFILSAVASAFQSSPARFQRVLSLVHSRAVSPQHLFSQTNTTNRREKYNEHCTSWGDSCDMDIAGLETIIADQEVAITQLEQELHQLQSAQRSETGARSKELKKIRKIV